MKKDDKVYWRDKPIQPQPKPKIDYTWIPLVVMLALTAFVFTIAAYLGQ